VSFGKLTGTLSKGSYLFRRTKYDEKPTTPFQENFRFWSGASSTPRVTRDAVFTADKKGYIFSEFFKFWLTKSGKPLPPLVLKHPDHALNEYTQNYGLVAVVRDQRAINFVSAGAGAIRCQANSLFDSAAF